jgi:hypothetical protein
MTMPANPVFSVMTTIPTKTGFVWRSIETAPGTDVTAIYERLKDDGVILCTRVTSEPRGSDRVRVIRGREPIVLGKGIVGTITASHVDLVEG